MAENCFYGGWLSIPNSRLMQGTEYGVASLTVLGIAVAPPRPLPNQPMACPQDSPQAWVVELQPPDPGSYPGPGDGVHEFNFES